MESRYFLETKTRLVECVCVRVEWIFPTCVGGGCGIRADEIHIFQFVTRKNELKPFVFMKNCANFHMFMFENSIKCSEHSGRILVYFLRGREWTFPESLEDSIS